MINKRHASCIRKVRTFRGADVDSDHYLLFAQFNHRLSTKWNMVKKSTREKYNIQRLENSEVQKRFVKMIQENIQIKPTEEETQTIDSLWCNLKEAVTNSDREHLGVEKRKSRIIDSIMYAVY
jgi:arginyl-tRNA--protein-N-Asp/Glu arginylyltransferase